MRLIALLTAFNEERFIARCLEHLVAQGAEVYLVDNQSTDRTVAIAEGFRGRGLVDILTLPREGTFDLAAILAHKEHLASTLEADWFLNVDADEFHVPPRVGQTLVEALAEVDRAGDNVVNFLEFAFVPTQEAPDHDHPDFQQSMRWYYLHVPDYPFLMRAWKKQPGPVGLVRTGGHALRFPGLRLHQQPFFMRHYICLSADHAARKYASRIYSDVELRAGWHGWRAHVQAATVRLPRQADLAYDDGRYPLDTSKFRLHDILDNTYVPPTGAYPAPVCIAGLDPSGTALMARLLHQCGLYLGPESEWLVADPQKQAGHWEHASFVELNEAVLAQLGGSWDVPPAVVAGWDLESGLLPMRVRAAWLVERFARHAPWGWKDPRTSLTWAFWKRLLPGLKVVLCVCNPLEAARALGQQRASSVKLGLNLWLAYNERLLSEVPAEDRVVVQAASLAYNARAELQRLAEVLHLPASEADLERALSGVAAYLRQSHSNDTTSLQAAVPDKVWQVYTALCAEAGPVYRQSSTAESLSIEPAIKPGLSPTQQDFALSMQLDRLQTKVIADSDRLAAMTAQLGATQQALAVREQQARTLQALLVEKTQDIDGLQAQIENSKCALDAVQAQHEAVRLELEAIHQAKFWTIMSAYWRALYAIRHAYHTLIRQPRD